MDKEAQNMVWAIGLIVIAVAIITIAKVGLPTILETIFSWFDSSLKGIKM